MISSPKRKDAKVTEKTAAAGNKQLNQTSTASIYDLLQKYIPKIPSGGKIPKIKLTKKALQHVFEINFQQKKDEDHPHLHGFHHCKNNILAISNQFFLVIPWNDKYAGFHCGYIAVRKTDMPVFKSFFPAHLSRDEVLDLLITSLNNIKEINKTLEGYKITGQIPDGPDIMSVVRDGKLITFYPLIEEENPTETRIVQNRHKLCFLDPLVRTAITENEITNLMKLYPDGIKFNMMFYPYEDRRMWPYDGLVFKKSSPQAPNIRTIDKIPITPEILRHVFSDKNDANYPPSLTRVEILNLLEDTFTNFARAATDFEPIPSSGKSYLFYRNVEKEFWISSNVTTRDGSKSFKFTVMINKETGNLVNFYPTAGPF